MSTRKVSSKPSSLWSFFSKGEKNLNSTGNKAKSQKNNKSKAAERARQIERASAAAAALARSAAAENALRPAPITFYAPYVPPAPRGRTKFNNGYNALRRRIELKGRANNERRAAEHAIANAMRVPNLSRMLNNRSRGTMRATPKVNNTKRINNEWKKEQARIAALQIQAALNDAEDEYDNNDLSEIILNPYTKLNKSKRIL
jgi:hypothetical protein